MKIWNRIARLVLFVAVALHSVGAFAQAGSAPDVATLDGYFAESMKQWQVPGMAVAIIHDGQVVMSKGYGVRHVAEGGAVDENTLFAIASNSKAFTAATLAMLVDQGKIAWDDRVTQHLPYFQLKDAFASREMRIRDLLCHRSGLGTYSGDLLWYGTSYSAEEVIKRVRQLPATSSFRSKYGYSNLMFITAGEVVHAVAGMPWQDFVQQRILDKLEMRNTVISISDLQGKANVATPHRVADGKLVPIAWYGWDNMAAAGGIISSVSDMSKWLKLQLDGGVVGDDSLFSKKQSRTMWAAHTAIPVSKKSEERFPSTHFRAYGLGWSMMDYQGHKVLQHGGGYDGMFSRVVMAPEKNLGLVILTNGMTSLQTALAYRTLDAYLGGAERDWSSDFLAWSKEGKQKKAKKSAEVAEQRVGGTKPSLPLQSYAGTFGGAMYGDARVSLEDGALVLKLLPNADLVGDLTHWHFDTFVLKWRKQFAWFDDGKVLFVLDQNGKVQEMKIDVPNEDFWFTELKFERK